MKVNHFKFPSVSVCPFVAAILVIKWNVENSNFNNNGY